MTGSISWEDEGDGRGSSECPEDEDMEGVEEALIQWTMRNTKDAPLLGESVRLLHQLKMVLLRPAGECLILQRFLKVGF